jgi:hypothetical protein
MLSTNFSLQNDKSTDTVGHTQLTANIRYLGISSQSTSFSATANDILCIAYQYLSETELQCNACTDAAFSDGKVRCSIAIVKEMNPEIRSHLWLVYYKANDATIPPSVHKNVLQKLLISYNHSLSIPSFFILCHKLPSEHSVFLVCTTVQCCVTRYYIMFVNFMMQAL